ncbi:adenylate/guanylate cyclase domain-containing protein [uncultured Shimia sp.]|uniref:adenylate/guanylate cyclase domain-containing protein n=1 Tax=uncultured Shimia sp. TaxID=573152 RepID=UPI00261B644F|nr:adenylate/guanylate cyclase domain-containing protein [uncultured Shimia sp.]
MRYRTKRNLTLFAVLVLVSASFAPLYGVIFVPDFSDRPIFSYVLDGLIGGTFLWSGVILLWPSKICAPLRRLAVPWHVLMLLVYTALSIPFTEFVGGLWHSDQTAPLNDFDPGLSLFLYILVIVFGALVVIEVASIIGPRILVNFLAGRYHKPAEERRVFLFVDLVGSTAMARELGDMGVQRLLTRFFFDLGKPVADNSGEIHAYVGDMVIITWPYEKGLHNARCVRCFFGIQDALEKNAKSYEKEFGLRPQIRAGLHGGPVIVSECGDFKKSVVYFGDTMNTTGRLEGVAKALKQDLVITRALLDDLTLSQGVVAHNLEAVTLRGHKNTTEIAALSRTK